MNEREARALQTEYLDWREKMGLDDFCPVMKFGPIGEVWFHQGDVHELDPKGVALSCVHARAHRSDCMEQEVRAMSMTETRAGRDWDTVTGGQMPPHGGGPSTALERLSDQIVELRRVTEEMRAFLEVPAVPIPGELKRNAVVETRDLADQYTERLDAASRQLVDARSNLDQILQAIQKFKR